MSGSERYPGDVFVETREGAIAVNVQGLPAGIVAAIVVWAVAARRRGDRNAR